MPVLLAALRVPELRGKPLTVSARQRDPFWPCGGVQAAICRADKGGLAFGLRFWLKRRPVLVRCLGSENVSQRSPRLRFVGMDIRR
ncbi:hypothetical protein AOLI_G00222600 [Acnodon oligacanthus]